MASTPAGAHLPKLKLLDLSTPHAPFTEPKKRINDGNDVAHFLKSQAYRDIGLFILQLNHAVIPRNQPSSSLPLSFPLTPARQSSSETPSIQALQALLTKVRSFVDEAPPDPGPRRFGNVSFRKWCSLLEERVGGLLDAGLLGETLRAADGAKVEVSRYLIGAFGSSQRLDYGTGHELSFLAFLGSLWKLGYFKDGKQDGEIEREIVLSVIEPYLNVVRKLILTYTLEPAGSHGVWGLDDHAFIPYIFGSAQLTRPINPTDVTPVEGSVRGAPRPADVAKPQAVEDNRQSNMYFSAIGFINDVKTGPFWEHSPILFDISGIRDGWGKINKGMIKMFNAEVLSKFPVVQHFPFGALFSWDLDPDAPEPVQSVHMANYPMAAAATTASATGPAGAGAGAMPPPTGAPWAQTTRMPGPPPTVVPGRVPPPGPRTGSLNSGGPPLASGGETTAAQITVTKAPWAK